MAYASEFFVMMSSEDSLDFFPENTPSDFYVRLPYLLMLDGDWFISINQIWMPKMWYNVQDTTIEFKKYKEETEVVYEAKETTHITGGYYESVGNLIEEINRCTAKDSVHYSVMGYDSLRHKVTIDVLKGYELELSKELSTILGASGTRFRGKNMLSMCPDLSRYESIAYIYIDVIEGQLSGGGVCNVIKMMNTYDSRFGDNIYDNIETNFARIASDRFDTVHITVKNRFGATIKQEGGVTILQLHFRRA